jgi:hypothetical protein
VPIYIDTPPVPRAAAELATSSLSWRSRSSEDHLPNLQNRHHAVNLAVQRCPPRGGATLPWSQLLLSLPHAIAIAIAIAIAATILLRRNSRILVDLFLLGGGPLLRLVRAVQGWNVGMCDSSAVGATLVGSLVGIAVGVFAGMLVVGATVGVLVVGASHHRHSHFRSLTPPPPGIPPAASPPSPPPRTSRYRT